MILIIYEASHIDKTTILLLMTNRTKRPDRTLHGRLKLKWNTVKRQFERIGAQMLYHSHVEIHCMHVPA